MPTLTLIYFDVDGGRGEPARLALRLAGLPFEDRRVAFKDWPAMKSSTPFGGIPVLLVDGEAVSQSNTINRFVGRLAGLYPEDPWQAARCDEVMDATENVGAKMIATMSIQDPVAQRRARETLVKTALEPFLKQLAARLEEGAGEYFVEDRLTMADLRVFMLTRALLRGVMEHVPRDLAARVAPALVAHHEHVAATPGIAAYYASRG